MDITKWKQFSDFINKNNDRFNKEIKEKKGTKIFFTENNYIEKTIVNFYEWQCGNLIELVNKEKKEGRARARELKIIQKKEAKIVMHPQSFFQIVKHFLLGSSTQSPKKCHICFRKVKGNRIIGYRFTCDNPLICQSNQQY